MIRLTVERQGVARLPPTRGGLRIGGFCRHDSAVRHCQQGKGPIRANGKGLVFSRRVGDALSKNFANLRSDSSTLGEETHPRACGTRTISGRECPCGHSLPHRSAQSVLSVRTCSAVRHCQQGKGPIRANGKGLVFSRRVGDALSKNFANLRSDSSTLGEETHPRACGTRTISGRECPCGHSLPHRSAQSVLSVRTCRSASGGFRVSSRGGLSASRGGCRVRVV